MKTTTCDQLKQKRTSKGKQKIPITRIIDKNSRQVTFSKRRIGLFGKCLQLSSQFPNTQFAAITFSVGGKPFSDGYPSVDTVVNRFLDDTRKHGNSRNVVGDGNNWWENPIDDMKLEDLEKFKEALEGLKTQVASRVDEISRFNEPDVINCNDYECNYASPSPKFSDYCQEISESSDFGAMDADFGTLFDVIQSGNYGCNHATASAEFSDNCPELLENIDFESVDATNGAQLSDFLPEIESIDSGCNNNATASPEFSDNCPELLENIDFESVDASHGAQLSDFLPEIESQIESVDFGSNAETLTPQFSHNSQERRKSFDLSEVLESIYFECSDASLSHTPSNKSPDVTECFDFGSVDAGLGTQASDYSSWMDDSIVPEFFPKYLRADDSHLLGALSCC